MFNSLNNENIILKSQMYEKTQPDKILGDSFAKTINCNGIHNNFFLDIPEIIEEEEKQQERLADIAKFTKLALSDVSDSSDKKLIQKLFSDEDFIDELSFNNDLIKDLGF